MSVNSSRLFHALGTCEEEDPWISTLLRGLPKLVVSRPITQPTSAEYNSQWKKEFENVVTEEKYGFVSDTAFVEVFQYETFPYLSVAAEQAPITAELNIANADFKQLLKAQLANNDDGDDSLVLVSFASGLILNVDEKLIGLVSRKNDIDTAYPPHVFAIDGASQGPLYFSFYVRKSQIDALLADTTTVISVEINFFTSQTSKVRLALGTTTNQATAPGVRPSATGGKTYSVELADGRSIDQVWNLKKADSCITEMGEICEPSSEISGGTAPGSGKEHPFSLSVADKLHVSFGYMNTAEERISLLIMPRLRNSFGSQLCYTPGLVGVYSTEDSILVRTTKFYPVKVLNSQVEAETRAPKGSLCFCFVGGNVNSKVSVRCLPDKYHFRFLNAKPGLNGSVAYFIGTPIYRELLHYLRQRRLIRTRIEDDLKDTAYYIVQQHSIKEENRSVYLVVLKALMYCSYIVPKRLECLSEFDGEEVSRELVETLLTRKGFLADEEREADDLVEYSAEDERFVLSHVTRARERESERGAISFLQFLAKAQSESAKFDAMIRCRLMSNIERTSENEENVLRKRAKLAI